MGINLGALLAPLVVGSMAQRESFKNLLASVGFDPIKSWHWAFSAAGFFMVLGLVQYVLGRNRLRGVGEKKTAEPLTDIAEVLDVGEEVESQGFDIVTTALPVLGGVLGFLGGVKWRGAGLVGGLFPGGMFFFLVFILGPLRGLDPYRALRIAVLVILFIFS